MFGYIRPNRGELKVNELDAYQAVYCGLCHTIGQRHGLFARMFLSYDIVFLAMLIEVPGSRISTERRRCPARLWCRKKTCAAGVTGLDHAADIGTILSYWKLRDSIRDGSPAERIAARLSSMALHRGYRKASAALPAFDQNTKACLDELHILEDASAPSLDRPADTFARILQSAVPEDMPERQRRAAEQVLYHVGRWIYLLDAWDDIEDDIRSGSYNPIYARFSDDYREQQDYLRVTLRHSRNIAVSAWNLLDQTVWSGIIGNILYLGMPLVEDLVFSGQWKMIKNRIRRTNT